MPERQLTAEENLMRAHMRVDTAAKLLALPSRQVPWRLIESIVSTLSGDQRRVLEALLGGEGRRPLSVEDTAALLFGDQRRPHINKVLALQAQAFASLHLRFGVPTNGTAQLVWDAINWVSDAKERNALRRELNRRKVRSVEDVRHMLRDDALSRTVFGRREKGREEFITAFRSLLVAQVRRTPPPPKPP